MTPQFYPGGLRLIDLPLDDGKHIIAACIDQGSPVFADNTVYLPGKARECM